MKRFKRVIISLIFVFILILFTTLFHFFIPKVNCVSEASGTISHKFRYQQEDDSTISETKTLEIGKDFTAIRIDELKDLNQITKINYIPDEYILPGKITENMQIVDLTKPFEFSKKGTLILIIMNINPEDEEVYQKIDSLSKYMVGEYWRFSLTIPHIFSASSIYNKSALIQKNGELENYSFIDYTTFDTQQTEHLKMESQAVNIDLRFYARRKAIENNLNHAELITIHYQSKNTSISGIKDLPLIGTEKEIKIITNQSKIERITFSIVSLLVLVLFIVLSILKKTKQFLSCIVWVSGVLLMMFSLFMLGSILYTPYLWYGLKECSIFLVLGGALYLISNDYHKFKMNYSWIILTCIASIIAFTAAFVPMPVAHVLNGFVIGFKCLFSTFIIFFLILELLKKENYKRILAILCIWLIAAIGIASIFLETSHLTYEDPCFWLEVLLILMTSIYFFILFYEIEQSNRYLTKNMQLEVERQVHDIKSVIKERDNLLQFVSHDIKKPLLRSSALMDNLIKKETNQEQVKGLSIIKQNTDHAISNLSEIGNYTRFNYIAEPSTIVDLQELCASIYDFHHPDCNANGIILKNLVHKNFKIYAKRQALENAASNIIMNAIEHANCQTITLSIKTEKTRTILCIADDGEGIKTTLEFNQPYSTNAEKNNGVGLFICKNIVESMNGELSYYSESGKTEFYISLLNA